MSVDHKRVVEVYAKGATDVNCGSGYLIADDLVLTAAHVLDRHPERLYVRPLDTQDLFSCELAWKAPNDVDACLLRVDRPASQLPPVRWGRLVTLRPGIACEAWGFPTALRHPSGRPDVEQLSGRINPGTGRKAGLWHVAVHSPPTGSPSPWAGMSGAPLFCDDLLAGVIAQEPKRFAPTRVAAVPVAAFAADPGFLTTIAGSRHPTPTLEPVELIGLLSPPSVGDLRSPAYLLRAEVGMVGFHGRDEVLAELRAWCRSTDHLAGRLITGPGGQGKSRLAYELCLGIAAEGAGWADRWICGFVAGTPPPRAMGNLTHTVAPLLLIIDYADTRPELVCDIVRKLAARSTRKPARLLLLARSANVWWDEMRLDEEVNRLFPDRAVLELPPLEQDASRRDDAYRTAVQDLTAGLGLVEGHQVADPAGIKPPDLSDLRYANALTLQMTALADILAQGTAGEFPDEHETLLRHERRYWAGSARAHGLTWLSKPLREQVVAAAVLCGAASEAEAVATLGRLPDFGDQPRNTFLPMAEWLHDLYPAADGYWGPLQPDRLGEYLVRGAVDRWRELPAALLPGASDRQLHTALHVLARASDAYPQLRDTLSDLVARHPGRIGPATVKVAPQAEDPDSLLLALRALTSRTDLSFEVLQAISDEVSSRSRLLGPWAVELSEAMLRALGWTKAEQAKHIGPWRARVAWTLSNHAARLLAVGRFDAAEAAIEAAGRLVFKESSDHQDESKDHQDE